MAFRPPNVKALINLKVLAGVAKPNPKMGSNIIFNLYRSVPGSFGNKYDAFL